MAWEDTVNDKKAADTQEFTNSKGNSKYNEALHNPAMDEDVTMAADGKHVPDNHLNVADSAVDAFFSLLRGRKGANGIDESITEGVDELKHFIDTVQTSDIGNAELDLEDSTDDLAYVGDAENCEDDDASEASETADQTGSEDNFEIATGMEDGQQLTKQQSDNSKTSEDGVKVSDKAKQRGITANAYNGAILGREITESKEPTTKRWCKNNHLHKRKHQQHKRHPKTGCSAPKCTKGYRRRHRVIKKRLKRLLRRISDKKHTDWPRRLKHRHHDKRQWHHNKHRHNRRHRHHRRHRRHKRHKHHRRHRHHKRHRRHRRHGRHRKHRHHKRHKHHRRHRHHRGHGGRHRQHKLRELIRKLPMRKVIREIPLSRIVRRIPVREVIRKIRRRGKKKWKRLGISLYFKRYHSLLKKYHWVQKKYESLKRRYRRALKACKKNTFNS